MIPFPPNVALGALEEGFTVLAEDVNVDVGVGVGSGAAACACRCCCAWPGRSPPKLGTKLRRRFIVGVLVEGWGVM